MKYLECQPANKLGVETHVWKPRKFSVRMGEHCMCGAQTAPFSTFALRPCVWHVLAPPPFSVDVGWELTIRIPALVKANVWCPLQCPDTEVAWLRGMIIHLNDYHKWTREQIADWLESLDVDLSFGSVGA